MRKKNITHRNAVTAGIALIVMTLTAVFLSAGAVQAAYTTIGEPGNSDDTVGNGYGGVSYEYKISETEVSVNEWQQMPNYNAIGGDGAQTGDEPAGNMTLYQASAYANYMTSGDPDKGLYDISWDGTAGNSNAGGWVNTPAAHDSATMDGLVDTYDGTVYAIPTEDEWYKAAFYSLAKSTAGTNDVYYAYVDGTDNLIPEGFPDGAAGWNYHDTQRIAIQSVPFSPEEQNGTYDMAGNVHEWTEDSVRRGGNMNTATSGIDSSFRDELSSTYQTDSQGFRLVAVPEPSSLALLALGGLLLMKRRRRRV